MAITQPLNNKACKQADDVFYCKWNGQGHDTILFDGIGNRIPLKSDAPSDLRIDWCNLYEAILAHNAGGTPAFPDCTNGHKHHPEDCEHCKEPKNEPQQPDLDPIDPCPECGETCDCSIVKIQYKLNGTWTDVPAAGFTDIGLYTSITFKALVTGGGCAPGKISWGMAASGTGEEKQVHFSNSGCTEVTVNVCGDKRSISVDVDSPNLRKTITWKETYKEENTGGSSTTTDRAFTMTYTASAHVDDNKWMMRVESIEGGADIVIKTGGSRNADTNPPISEAEARDAVTEMKGYYNNGRGSWHTAAATRAHEDYHYVQEWQTICEHYWPKCEEAVEKLETTYHDHATEAAAVAKMIGGVSGAAKLVVDYKKVCRDYWMKLSDAKGSRPYAAGQKGLNPTIQNVQTLAARNGWNVPAGVDTPSDADPCYLAWDPYNP